MPYIGNNPANTGNYGVLDDISGSFNGSTTSFAMTINSGTAISPTQAGQLIINISGVQQEPDLTGTNGFKISGSNIVFSSAPAAADTFWGVILGAISDIGTPSEGSVDTIHLADDSIETAKIADNAITSAKIGVDVIVAEDLANNAITVAELADDAVTIAKLAATGTASSSTFLRGDNTWAAAGSTSASDLTSGTLPDGRFPATLPAISGANLTGISATDSTKLPLAGGTLTGNTNLTKSSPVLKVNESGGGDVRIHATGSAGGIGTYSNHTFSILTNSTARLNIDSSGKVGIGTASPADHLDVVGNIKASGYITAPTINITGKADFQGEAAIEGGTGYGVFKGYTTNSNHMLISRGILSGTTGAPTITGGHQMTFVEYCNSDTDAGFFFKNSGVSSYPEVARITTGGIKSMGNDVLVAEAGAVLQVKSTASGTRVGTTHTSWTEPSTSYRVSITPKYSNSMIVLQYHIPFNQTSAANILTGFRAFRIIGSGSKSYALTSAGNSNGSRHVIAGGYIRPGNGYDGNDMNIEPLHAIDHPGTTTTCHYGFESYPENTNNTKWGYSSSNNATWGWDADIVITAMEVKV